MASGIVRSGVEVVRAVEVGGRRGVRGFSLVELLVVVAIIGILIALILPGLSSAKENQRLTGCHGNMRQIWVVLNAYGNDFREFFPSADAVGNFSTRMAPGKVTAGSSLATEEVFGLPALADRIGYVSAGSGVWLCPGTPAWMRAWGNSYNYSINSVVSTRRRDDLLRLNPTTGLVFDNATATPGVTGLRGPAHNGGAWTVPSDSVWTTTTWSTTIPSVSHVTFHRVAGWKTTAAQNANWLYPTGSSKLLYQ